VTVLRSGSASDVGRVRSVNEDLALESMTLFAVADGMGGHAGGEIAARTAIDTLKAEFTRHPSADGLAEAVHEANRSVWERGRADPDLRGMGTTLIAAALVATDTGDRLVIANVGDSRAYRMHGEDLVQLTTDHSVAEELVARGELSEEEAATHPHRHILTRALGVGPSVDVDLWEVVPEEGDRYILCSDGLTNEVPTERIANVLTASREPQEAAEALVAMANRAGGSDNITAVVLDVVVGEPFTTGSTTAGGADVPAFVGSTADGLGGMAKPSSATTMMASPTLTATAPAVASDTLAPPQPRDATSVVSRSETRTGLGRSPDPRRVQHPRIHIPRRITFRVVLFLMLLGGVVYAGYASVHWYVYGSYYVGLNHQQVVIYQGRPGGFVGIEPRVVWRSQMTTADVPAIKLPDLRAGVQTSSYSAARTYITQLQAAQCSLEGAPATCTPTTTTPNAANSTPTSTVAFGRAAAPIGGGAAI
jgi:PPM family protein phosphatase